MNTFTISAAGIPVQISSFQDEIKQFCINYLTVQPPQFSVISSKQNIAVERERSILYKENQPFCPYSDTLLEFFSIHRELSDKLADFNVFLMHGSSFSMNGEGYIFLADSGTGKSTHVQLWATQFGNCITVINDDKPFIRYLKNKYQIYGSPWNGKENIGNNVCAILRYVVVLERSKRNEICKISPEAAYFSLLKHTYFPKGEDRVKNILPLLSGMAKSVDFYHLECTKDIDAALIAYRGIHSMP